MEMEQLPSNRRDGSGSRLLTVDEVLSHFGQRKASTQQRYGEFVQCGINSPSIWENLEAQSLLGVEGLPRDCAL
jgi:hypothetical protein